ncbi:hypothetical protein HCQ94_01365 [Actinomyces sp. zg-332]|uniref:hypothetical protein n=1 Tax=Actinomyces sp. zg-332 TaxID=2708340 RepID=UPI0014215AF8|nr:hypothetical protein [Actinomyces sp. zg-332]QPK94384.1 hypothetical protein HCQ94_01365 [Actinomyces sp. zg-332]
MSENKNNTLQLSLTTLSLFVCFSLHIVSLMNDVSYIGDIYALAIGGILLIWSLYKKNGAFALLSIIHMLIPFMFAITWYVVEVLTGFKP